MNAIGSGGIIPARAGFTGDFGLNFDYSMGSSPLARGLLRSVTLTGALYRIIPARAGFTATSSRAGTAFRDHPRSRGVYPGHWAYGRPRPGSSPLARGLHSLQFGDTIEEGIIPARAGFTPPGATAVDFRGDHPRSRGVYANINVEAWAAAGSSPLARGLPGRTPW